MRRLLLAAICLTPLLVPLPSAAQEVTLEQMVTFIRKTCPRAKLPDARVLAVTKSVDEYGEDVCDITIRIGGTHFTAMLPGPKVRNTHCIIHVGSGKEGKGPLHETRFVMDCDGSILIGDTPEVPGFERRSRLIWLETGHNVGLEYKPFWDEQIKMTVHFLMLSLLKFQPSYTISTK